jgi:excisionase family DNA binding protein
MQPMSINLKDLPNWVKIEIKKGDLQEFAEQLLKGHSDVTSSESDAPNEILSIDEASLLTKLAKQTLYSLSSQRKIPAYKRGKRILFKRSELENWLLENRRKTVSEIQQEVKSGTSFSYVTKKGGKE